MLLNLYVKGRTLLWGVRDKVTREDGAVATEYGLLLVLIALLIVAGATRIGIALDRIFTDAATDLS